MADGNSVDIQNLEIKISSNATGAAKSISSLITKLNDLKTACKGGCGLMAIVAELNSVRGAVKNLDNSAGQKLINLADGLSALKGVGKLSVDPNLATTLGSLNTVVASMSADTGMKLQAFADGLNGLSTVGKISISSTLGKHLSEIVDAAHRFSTQAGDLTQMQNVLDTLAWSQMPTISSSLPKHLNEYADAATRLSQVDASGLSNLSGAMNQFRGSGITVTTVNNLTNLADAAERLNGRDFSGLRQLAQHIRTLSTNIAPVAPALNNMSNALRQNSQAANQASRSASQAGTGYMNLYAAIMLARNSISRVSRTLSGFIDKANRYIENVNLFTVSMGEYAESAKQYADQVGEIMGIDPGAWMRNQGVFQTLSTGFGVAGDRAAKMSKNLTQLGYDLSSFFNIAVDGEGGSMQKLQAGLSGELEPLRRLGFDLSEARLKAVAAELGIKKTYKAMNQAEKAQLRYYAIMNQVTTAQGDMARTLDTPANQLRILSAQVEQAGRAIGTIFIPVLNQVLPYLIAFAKAVRIVAQTIAEALGFKMPEIDYSSVTNAADASEDLSNNLGKSGKNAKKLNELLADWDELNIIASESGSNSNGSGAGAGAGGFDFDLPEYDFLGGLTKSKIDEFFDKMKPAIEWIQAHLKPLLSLVKDIGIALLAWKVSTIFKGDLGGVVKLVLGIGLAIYGAAGAYEELKDQWENGVTVDNMLKLFGKLALVTVGLGIAFGVKGLGIGLVISGIAAVVGPLKELWETGNLTEESLEQLTIGAILLGAGITLLKTKSLKSAIGIAIALYGVSEAIKDVKTQWENGVTFENMKDLLKDVGIIAFGLFVAFGMTGLAVGLLIGAVALAIAPIKEFMETGELSEEAAQQLGVAFILAAAGATLLATGSLKAAIGVGLAAYGLIEAFKDIKEQWEHGVTFENMIDLFKKLGIMALGLGLAFGMKGIGIGLVVAGLASILTPMKELVETGKMSEDAFKQLEIGLGLLSAGLTALTRNPWILLIGAIIAGVVALIQYWPEIEKWWNTEALPFLQQFWEDMQNDPITGPIISAVESTINAISAFLADPGGAFEGAWNTITGWVKTQWDGFVEELSKEWEWLKGEVSRLWKTYVYDDPITGPIVQGIEKAFNFIKNLVTNPEKTIGEVWEKIKETWARGVDWITRKGDEIRVWWDGIVEANPFLKGARNIIRKVINFVNEVSNDPQAWWDKTWASISGWFADKINGIGGWLSGVWESLVKEDPYLQKVVDDVRGFIDEIKSFFDDPGAWITGKWNAFAEAVSAEWTRITSEIERKAREDSFLGPIIAFFEEAIPKIKQIIAEPEKFLQEAWDRIKNWFHDTIIVGIGNMFIDLANTVISGLNSVSIDILGKHIGFNIPLIERMKTTAEEKAAQVPVEPVVTTEGLDAMKKDLEKPENGVEITVGADMTGLTDEMKRAESEVDTSTRNMLADLWRLGSYGIVPGAASPTFGKRPSWKPVDPGLGSGWYMKTYASGGFPDAGEMFVAREAGPELVGTIGGRSAVVNNDDIESGIADGVKEANSEQNALLQAGINYLRIIAARSGNSGGFGPSVELGRIVKRSEELRLQAEGV